MGKKVRFGIPLNKQQQEHNSDGTIVSSTAFTSKSEVCLPFDDWTSGSSSLVIRFVEFSREGYKIRNIFGRKLISSKNFLVICELMASL